MATTNVYDGNLSIGALVTSASFSIALGGSAAIRLVGAVSAGFSARLDYSDGSAVVHENQHCVLRSTHTCLTLMQAGTYVFVISNPAKDTPKIEVIT